MTTGLCASGVREEFSTMPPISLYGATKLASEVVALEYGETFGFPVWVDRCGVLAGAGQFGTAEQGIFSYWIHAHRAAKPLRFTGFGGCGFQVRDALHPDDLAALVAVQLNSSGNAPRRVFNAGGGLTNATSLAQLAHWCDRRFGPHPVTPDSSPRPFDVPWLIMDSGRAQELFDWHPVRTLPGILEEIGTHAEQNPDWLRITGA
jgi:CDP-paratose 2-epimerase